MDLLFPADSPGGTMICADISIAEDDLTEGDETFLLFLSLPADSSNLGVVLGNDITTVTING